jgi:hypothetical protein
MLYLALNPIPDGPQFVWVPSILDAMRFESRGVADIVRTQVRDAERSMHFDDSWFITKAVLAQ